MSLPEITVQGIDARKREDLIVVAPTSVDWCGKTMSFLAVHISMLDNVVRYARIIDGDSQKEVIIHDDKALIRDFGSGINVAPVIVHGDALDLAEMLLRESAASLIRIALKNGRASIDIQDPSFEMDDDGVYMLLYGDLDVLINSIMVDGTAELSDISILYLVKDNNDIVRLGFVDHETRVSAYTMLYDENVAFMSITSGSDEIMKMVLNPVITTADAAIESINNIMILSQVMRRGIMSQPSLETSVVPLGVLLIEKSSIKNREDQLVNLAMQLLGKKNKNHVPLHT